jgi:hypothetical protein
MRDFVEPPDVFMFTNKPKMTAAAKRFALTGVVRAGAVKAGLLDMDGQICPPRG